MNVSEIQHTIWLEKYRPQTLENIALNKTARNILQGFVEKGEIPNLFLCSRPGQGKTSLARLLANNVFGCDTLYVNASDENNVETMRNKVTNFAKTMSTNGKFKIIILDECDGFATAQSQKILRVLMEEVSDVTRFIIIANAKEKIIEAIQSRCYFLDITPDKNEIGRRMCKILLSEGIEVNEETLESVKQLISWCYPDVRSMIKHMQVACASGKFVLPKSIVDGSFATELFDKMMSGDPLDVRKFVIESEDMFNNDYQKLLDELYHLIINTDKLSPDKKIKWTITISDYLTKMMTSFDMELTFSACIFTLIG